MVVTATHKMIQPLNPNTVNSFDLGLRTPGGFRFTTSFTDGPIAQLKQLIEDYERRGYTVDGIKVYPL